MRLLLGPYPSHFGQANNPRRLVNCDDASAVPSLALSIAPCRDRPGRRVRPVGRHPAFRIEDQSLPEGWGISWFTQGWELRPPSIIKLSVQTFAVDVCTAPHPQTKDLFRGNGSHNLVNAERDN